MRQSLAVTIRSWRSEAKAVAWLLSGDVLARVTGQAAIIVTARYLGPDEYGTLAAGLAAFAIVMVLADLGTGDSAIQRLTGASDGTAEFWREVAPVRLFVALPLVPAGLALLILSSSGALQVLGILLAAVPFASLLTSRVMAARISETFSAAAGWSALLALSQALGGLGAVILIGRTGTSAAFGIALLIVMSGLVASRRSSWARPARREFVTWLRHGFPFGVTAAAVAIYSRADRVVVAVVVGTSAAGTYAAAYNIVMIAAIAGTALHAAILPRLLLESRQGTAVRWSTRATMITFLALPPALLLMLLSTPVVTGLYGSSFSASAPILRILTPLVVLYLVNPLLASTLVAAGRQGAVARIAVLNAAIAITTFPILTIWFGMQGTAAASVLVELVGTLLLVLSLRNSSPRAANGMLRYLEPAAGETNPIGVP